MGGGVDVPLYLGSRSTFPGGKLGGLQVGPRPDVHSTRQSFTIRNTCCGKLMHAELLARPQSATAGKHARCECSYSEPKLLKLSIYQMLMWYA